jgi:hypothetical protein
MARNKSRLGLVAAVVSLLALSACFPPAPSDPSPAPDSNVSNITFDGSPGTGAPPATLGDCTTMTPFAADARPLGNMVNDVTGPTGSVAFSASAQHFRIGSGWGTWSNGYAGDVYFSNGATSLTLTMPANTTAFYLYAEPVDFSTFTITATTQDSTTSGPISVNGNGGAKYFGFSASGGTSISTITVTTTDAGGFAVGEFGVCVPPPPPLVHQLTALSDVHAWLGLSNSDDNGTQFDLMAELLDNGTPVASGITRCITGITRNPLLATEITVPWDAFSPVTINSGDVLALRLSARVGTNPDGTQCAGPGGSHASAIGLRLYFDSTDRPSRFDMTITPDADTNEYLHSDGQPCQNAESSGATTFTVDPTAPGGPAAQCKDAHEVNFAFGNPWRVFGVWSRAPQA